MSAESCKRELEATNGGHYFAECRCGWSGGVHRDRAQAIIARQAHRDGTERVQPVLPTLLIGPRAHGQEAHD